MRTVLTAWVHGHPAPQGSMVGWKQGNAIRVQPSNKKALMAWRRKIEHIVGQEWCERPPIDEPVIVHATFYFERPASHYGTGRMATTLKRWALTHPTMRGEGDVDKLARALLDGLDASGVFVDDCRVRRLVVEKEFAQQGEAEGVMVAVSVDDTVRCTHCATTEAAWRHMKSRTKDASTCCSASSHDGATMTMTTKET